MEELDRNYVYSMKKSNMHRKQVRVGEQQCKAHSRSSAGVTRARAWSFSVEQVYVYSTENSLDQWRS
jgi:hypothetical protein